MDIILEYFLYHDIQFNWCSMLEYSDTNMIKSIKVIDIKSRIGLSGLVLAIVWLSELLISKDIQSWHYIWECPNFAYYNIKDNIFFYFIKLSLFKCYNPLCLCWLSL